MVLIFFKNFTFNDLVLLCVLSLVTALIFRVLHWRHGRKRLYELAAKVPTAKNMKMLPLIGHAHYFIGDTEKILKNIMMMCKDGTPSIVWLASRLFYTISEPEDLKIVMNSPKCFGKYELYDFIKPIGGDGLMTADVPTWRRHKKIIMPTFNQRILNQFVEIFSEQTMIMVDLLEAKVGKVFDISSYISKCNLDIVCQTAMGIKINAQTTNAPFEEYVTRLLEIIMTKMFNILYRIDFIYNLTNVSKEERRLVKAFNGFTQKIIDDKKNNLKKHGVGGNNKENKAFLDLLLEMNDSDGDSFSDRELRDEVNTFIVAAADTSATVDCFIFLMIAMYPDVQNKVYEEVMEILGPHRKIQHDDLPRFQYLEKVIKETLRIFPIGPVLVRQVSDDLQLTNYLIPKGAGAVLCIICTHRSPKIYKDPLKFDPERFDPDEISKRHPFSFLPFSGGPRSCIGPKYAMMNIKTLIANVVRRYKVETPYKTLEEIRVKQSLILRAVDGFNIKLIPRPRE